MLKGLWSLCYIIIREGGRRKTWGKRGGYVVKAPVGLKLVAPVEEVQTNFLQLKKQA